MPELCSSPHSVVLLLLPLAASLSLQLTFTFPLSAAGTPAEACAASWVLGEAALCLDCLEPRGCTIWCSRAACVGR